MRTDPKQSDENREEAGLEEALKLWMEIRQVDRKKGWERLEAEIGRQHGLRRQERTSSDIGKWRTNFVRRGAGSEAGRRKQEFCDRSPEKKYRLY